LGKVKSPIFKPFKIRQDPGFFAASLVGGQPCFISRLLMEEKEGTGGE